MDSFSTLTAKSSLVSSVDTVFYADHKELLRALRRVKESLLAGA